MNVTKKTTITYSFTLPDERTITLDEATALDLAQALATSLDVTLTAFDPFAGS